MRLFKEFNLKQVQDDLDLFQFSKVHGKVEGKNVIAIKPGAKWGSGDDRIIIIGAHWDTVRSSPGFNDNGSGVAAMLEMARVLAMANCQNEYTVIFVGFDLEEYGVQGGTAFVQDFLVPEIIFKHNFPYIQVRHLSSTECYIKTLISRVPMSLTQS